MFIVLTATIVYQSASASQNGLDLMFDNIDALALGESSGQYYVIYNPIGYDCYSTGSWSCPRF